MTRLCEHLAAIGKCWLHKVDVKLNSGAAHTATLLVHPDETQDSPTLATAVDRLREQLNVLRTVRPAVATADISVARIAVEPTAEAEVEFTEVRTRCPPGYYGLLG
jgi:hypothetical protein